ncbi:MAG: lysophospholipid acyltransferase family protein [Lutibacter sp.]|uniref:lysophospholipid acyltransferase family protein n=1 Tax=Lutibacter sp. TaxID=1925666 RepID=UPI00385D8020
MDLLIYIVTYPLIWFISILPFRVLYFISDGVYLFIYYIIGYRKKVVLANLKLAYPNKPLKELIEIRKKFYHHFVDMFLEMVKSFTISKEGVYKRYKYINVDLLTEMYKDGKSAILMGPHYANWEWIMSIDSFVEYKGYAAYTTVNNKYFNKKILKSREKFGTNLVPTSKIISEIQFNKKNNIQAMYGLLSDQSPQLKKTFYWRKFFGIKVPVHTGAEMLAKKYNLNVVYMNVKKVKRGYYETTFSLITNDTTKHSNYEITDIFIDNVEKQVHEQPEYYFWTHKRFKHKDKVPVE